MEGLKKYAAVVLLLMVFPVIWFTAKNFVLEADSEVYSYIPQESDFVIEINTRNFVRELSYQRIYKAPYFLEEVYPETDEEPEKRLIETGLDIFGKAILFREQWANESVWIALLKYTDKELVKSFLPESTPNTHFEFAEDYVIVQLSASSDQEQLNEHLKKISRKEIKPFSERVNLSLVFDPEKEINCYVFPKNTPHNQLIDGYFSFDFLGDHIAIEGLFTPLSEFSETAPIAYSLNEDKAFSLRSSLNLFNSIYWFNGEKIENVPEYSQVAFDYDGVECRMIDKNIGFSTPFKSYPDIGVHFDILKPSQWQEFFDSLKTKNGILADTVNNSFHTPEGVHFNYALDEHHFELMQNPIMLSPSEEENLYLDFKMAVDPMIDRTTFTVDEDNPPGRLEQQMGMIVATKVLEEIRVLANMEWVTLRLTGNDNAQVLAEGRIEMKEKTGHSIVESLSFGAAAFSFVKNY